MNTIERRSAVFLDRDGTINVEKHYLIEPDKFEFLPGVPEALRKLQDAGFLLVVVTNQSGVARGFFSLSQVEQLHEYMSMLLADYGVALAGIYICPHHPTAGTGEYLQECCCRKGQPGLLQQAAEELAIDLQRSYVIGDKEADLQAGQAAGSQSFLVRTGYGEKFVETAFEYEAEVVADLPDAVLKILSQQL